MLRCASDEARWRYKKTFVGLRMIASTAKTAGRGFLLSPAGANKGEIMLVKDVMNADMFFVQPMTTLLDVAVKLLSSGVDTLFISQEGRLLGVIDLRDLFTAPIPAHYGGTMHGSRDETQLLDTWRTTSVNNLMNEKIISVAEDTPLLRAAELMVNTGKHPLPVMRDGKIVGVISRSDIVRALLGEA